VDAKKKQMGEKLRSGVLDGDYVIGINGDTQRRFKAAAPR